MGMVIELIAALEVGTVLVAEVIPTSPERRAWVEILPQKGKLDKRAASEGWKHSHSDRAFVVLQREYSRQHMENDWDMAPNDGLWEHRRAEVIGLDALEQLLESWSVPLDALQYLWKSDCPT